MTFPDDGARYVIEEQGGKGNFSVVFRAKRLSGQGPETVALKVLTDSSYAADATKHYEALATHLDTQASPNLLHVKVPQTATVETAGAPALNRDRAGVRLRRRLGIQLAR